MINTDTQSTGILPMILDETWYDDNTLKYKAGRYLWNLIEDHIDNDRAFQILNPSNIPFEIDRLLGMKYEPKAWYEYSKIQNQFGYITMVYLNRFIDTTTNEDINETDVNARWQLMIDAEKIMMDDLCYIPVFEKGTATLQNTKVKNLVIKAVGVPYTFEYVSK